MPQSERRLYEPSEDVRFFDGAQDDFEEEGSRLPLLIVIALVVLASFAGVVWLAYTQGVQRGREDAPRILAEQRGRGFATNPYSQLQIYKQHKQTESAAPTGTAPAPPATAALKRHSSAPPASASSAMGTPAVVASTAAPPQPKTTTTSPKPVTVAPQSAPAAPGSQNQAGARDTAASGAPRPIAQAPAPHFAAAPAGPRIEAKGAAPPIAKQSPPAPVHPQPLAPAAGIPATPPPAPNIQSDGYVFQIGSYTSAAEASTSWQTYKTAHPSVAGYTPDVQQADLGKKGTWYRLRVGPFTTMAEASAACARLKAQGGSCFPAKR